MSSPELGKGLANPLSQFADIIFQFSQEKSTLHGHSVVLVQRCPKLVNPGGKKKPQKKKGTTTINVPPSISQKILQEVLHYVYTGIVEFSKLSVVQVLQLNAAAAELELPRLAWMCEHYIQTNLAMENVFTVLKGAHNLNQKSVKEMCFHFALKNYNAFIGNKDGAKDLGIDLFQEVVEVYQQSLAGKVRGPPELKEPTNTLIEDYKAIYESMQGSDVTFKVSSDFIPCHKAILAAQSSELAQLCSVPPVKGKDGPEAIVLPPIKAREGKEGQVISGEAFKSMLKYLYYGDKSIDALPAVELIPFARDYGLLHLQELCERIIKGSIGKNTSLSILAVTYTPQMEDREIVKELRDNSIKYILDNITEVDLKPLRKMNPSIALDILLKRQKREKGIVEPSPTPSPKLRKTDSKTDSKKKLETPVELPKRPETPGGSRKHSEENLKGSASESNGKDDKNDRNDKSDKKEKKKKKNDEERPLPPIPTEEAPKPPAQDDKTDSSDTDKKKKKSKKKEESS